MRRTTMLAEYGWKIDIPDAHATYPHMHISGLLLARVNGALIMQAVRDLGPYEEVGC